MKKLVFLFLFLFSNASLAFDERPNLYYTFNKDAMIWNNATGDIRLGYKFLNKTIFISTKIKNTSDEFITVFLVLKNPKIDYVKLSYSEKEYITGDHFVFEERPVASNNFVFPITIKPNTTENILIEAKSNSAYYFPIRIYSQKDFFESNNNQLVLNMLGFGLMISMIIYNLGVFFTSKNKLYFYYTAFLVSVFMTMLSLSGYGYQYVWSKSIVFNNTTLLVFSTASCVFLSLFSVLFLDFKRHGKTFWHNFILIVNLPFFTYQMTYVLYYSVYMFGKGAKVDEILFNISFIGSFINMFVPSIISIFFLKTIPSARFYVIGMFTMITAFIFTYILKITNIDTLKIDDPNLIFAIGAIILSFTFSALIGVKQRNDYKERYKMRQQNEFLQKKNEEIKNMAETKTNFLANMSHEIRTPMNGVIGVSEMLKDTELDPQQREYVEIIQNSADSLVSIINDILDISKFEAGKMDLEEIDIDVRELIHTCVSMLVASKGSNLKTYAYCYKEVPEIIQGDPTRIRQIITNFMGNAYKFTESGFVKCIVSLIEQDTLKFEIIDSGIGIPEEAQNKLFSKYSQAAKDTARKFGGTGLGLDISKKLSTAMGGEVGLVSELGKGSNFWFTIKFKPENSKRFELLEEVVCEFDSTDEEVVNMAKNIGKKVLYDVKNKKELKFYSQYEMMTKKEIKEELKKEELDYSHIKVLVAEDNKTNQMVINGVLKKIKIKCDFADNGLIAVEKVKENKYNLIFMDCEMPEMDGWEATEEIRKFDKKLMIIGLSAHVMPEFEQKAIESGMDGFMAKPVKKDKMYAFFKETFK